MEVDKGELYLKAVYKNQKQTNGDEKQSSNQGRDKVAKQNNKVQINVNVQIKHGNKNAKKSKTYQTGNKSVNRSMNNQGQNTNNDRTGSEGNTETE